MKNIFSHLATMMVVEIKVNPYFKQRTITTPNSPKKIEYNLPRWKVGKHFIHAKNENEALKYAKKRGMWDGVSEPVKIM